MITNHRFLIRYRTTPPSKRDGEGVAIYPKGVKSIVTYGADAVEAKERVQRVLNRTIYPVSIERETG